MAKEYHVHSTDNGAGAQLDSMLSQIRASARAGKTWKASTVPGRGTLTFTLSIDLSEEQLGRETAQQRAERVGQAAATSEEPTDLA